MRRIAIAALASLALLFSCAPGFQGTSDGATLTLERKGLTVEVAFNPNGPAEAVVLAIGGTGLTTTDNRCEKRPSGLIGCKLGTISSATTVTVTGDKVRASATFYRPNSAVLVYVKSK